MGKERVTMSKMSTLENGVVEGFLMSFIFDTENLKKFFLSFSVSLFSVFFFLHDLNVDF